MPQDTLRYTEHRNMYNTLLRQQKQKYYAENLALNTKNPRRAWQLLKEAANLNKSNLPVEKIDKEGRILLDPTEIAEEFNDFFTSVGVKIAESVKPTVIQPEEYMPNLQNIQQLDLGTVNQVHICDIIKSLQPKNSMDIDGISTKLLTLTRMASLPLVSMMADDYMIHVRNADTRTNASSAILDTSKIRCTIAPPPSRPIACSPA